MGRQPGQSQKVWYNPQNYPVLALYYFNKV